MRIVIADLDQLPLVLSVKDVGEVLGIGRNSAYDLIRCGKIKSIRVGKQIRIPKQVLIEFLQQ